MHEYKVLLMCSSCRQAERMLREEAEADASLRGQFGARWARTESSKLTDGFKANGDKYRQIIDNAVRADNIVRDKYLAHKEVQRDAHTSHHRMHHIPRHTP